MQLRKIGRYQLLEIVGRGGQGTVYRGHDPSTGQIVAVKILAEGHSDGDFLERFQREASILASIEHPHVIKVFDHGEEEDRHYIVTEYVPENLARIIEQGDPLPIRRALTVAAQIASALAVTHENGVTHRDVKPANVLISDSGDVKLTDFGIATADVMTTVTTPDTTVGTPLYMSPEQIQSRDIDGRSDIYSLGCLLYQILTGRPPFQGESAYDIFNAHINGEYEPLSSVIESCPEELDNLLSKALEKNLNDRFQSADEFMDAIDEAADQLPDTGDQTLATRVMPRTIRSLSRRNSIWKRRTTWMTGAAAVAILAIIGFAATTMLGDGSAVGLATGVTDATESSLVAQVPIIVPEEPAMVADMPIAENIIFSAGPDPEYLYAQIPVPDEADVGRLSNISAFTKDLEGNEAKLNVKSVKTDTLRAPQDVLLLRAMEIAVEAEEIDTDTLRGIIEFQIKSQWIEESGILKDDIGLYRFKDEWQILPTTHKGSFIGSGDLFYERFSAETPGFSIFAIGITTSAQPENPVVQTQGAQPPEPTATEETVPIQQPTNNQSTQPPDSQSINEFPTPTPIAITDLQPSETATPEPVQAQPEPTATPIEITPQLPLQTTTTQEATGTPTATPKPTQMSSPTPVPSTPTPIPTPTPLPIELVKDGSMAQLSTGHHAFIEYPGDVDEWIYAPSSSMVGKPVSISVITDSTDSDGYLEFFSPSGDVIASDDDSGNNMNPLIGYVLLSEGGVYTVRFMTLDGTYGGYHLKIEPAGQTLPTATITPLPLATPTPLLTPTPTVSPTPTSIPTPEPVSDLQLMKCSEIEPMKSDPSTQESVSIEIRLLDNAGNYPLEVFWKDFQGEEVQYGTLGSGSNSFNISTYSEHPWVLRRTNGDCVTGFIVEKIDISRNPGGLVAIINLSTLENTLNMATPTPVPTATPTPTLTPTLTPTPSSTPIGFLGYSNGITWGKTTVSDGNLGGSNNGYFKVGNDLTQYYTKSNTQSGYFYRGSSGYPSPSISFGFVDADPPSCPWKSNGYTGFTDISMAGNLAGVPYSDITVSWDTREGTSCYFGLLPFKQGNRYGLLDPLSIDASGNLTLNWWVGDEGVTNFSNAPSLVTPSPTPTPSPLPTSTPTPTIVSIPTDLTVVDLGGGGYGGNYQMSGSYNGRPVWTNPLGGNTGYEPRHIFFSPQQVVSSNGTWVIQPGTPTDEWEAGGYYDCQGPPWKECSPGWGGFNLDVTVEASTAWQEWQDSS